MFVCQSLELFERAKCISSFGKVGGRYSYDIKYIGSNFRMTEFQAAIGLVQLGKLPGFVLQRKRNYRRYMAEITGISPQMSFSPYCFVLRDVKNRDVKIEEYEKRGIGVSVYYPHPIPRLKYYRYKYGYRIGEYPNAEEIADHSIAFPIGPHLDERDIGEVIEAIQIMEE
jgi:dTDP-4-amino-4,6-dideoxygalactose transaminase